MTRSELAFERAQSKIRSESKPWLRKRCPRLTSMNISPRWGLHQLWHEANRELEQKQDEQ